MTIYSGGESWQTAPRRKREEEYRRQMQEELLRMRAKSDTEEERARKGQNQFSEELQRLGISQTGGGLTPEQYQQLNMQRTRDAMARAGGGQPQGGYGGGGAGISGAEAGRYGMDEQQKSQLYGQYQKELAKKKRGEYASEEFITRMQGLFGNPLGSLADQYQQSFSQTQLANEKRYGDILKGYGERLFGLSEHLGSLGEQEAGNITRQAQSQGAGLQQQLASRGMYGSTVLPTMQTMVTRNKQEAMSGLKERLSRLALGYQGQYMGDMLGFMERKQDTYPDISNMQNLASGWGRQGYSLPYSWGQRR